MASRHAQLCRARLTGRKDDCECDASDKTPTKLMTPGEMVNRIDELGAAAEPPPRSRRTRSSAPIGPDPSDLTAAAVLGVDFEGAVPSTECRRCSDCDGQEHHWIDNPEFADEEDVETPEFACRHCDAFCYAADIDDGSGLPVPSGEVRGPRGEVVVRADAATASDLAAVAGPVATGEYSTAGGGVSYAGGGVAVIRTQGAGRIGRAGPVQLTEAQQQQLRGAWMNIVGGHQLPTPTVADKTYLDHIGSMVSDRSYMIVSLRREANYAIDQIKDRPIQIHQVCPACREAYMVTAGDQPTQMETYAIVGATARRARLMHKCPDITAQLVVLSFADLQRMQEDLERVGELALARMQEVKAFADARRARETES